jgi:signal transduction histidine kinase
MYGLVLFTMGLAVFIEGRRTSKLALGRHLPWLGGFALLQSIVAWTMMFKEISPINQINEIADIIVFLCFPLSALMLVRFGIGVGTEAGPLPDWLRFAPVVLYVPVVLIFAHVLIVIVTDSDPATAVETWSRYLFYLPGNLLAAFGFIRQWRRLRDFETTYSRHLLLGAAVAFGVNALVGGLIVPVSSHGIGPWLNYDYIHSLSGIPIEDWRLLTMTILAGLVIGAMEVFEVERRQQIARLEAERIQAEQAVDIVRYKARQSAEVWLDGLVSISRRIANLEDVDDVLLDIVKLTRQLMNADAATLALRRSSTQLDRHIYVTVEGGRQITSDRIKNPMILRALQQNIPMLFPQDSLTAERQWRCPITSRLVSTAAIVPLQLDGISIGVLWVERFGELGFSGADLDDLDHLANQTVIVLEHGSMAARLQSLAVVEERARIAREMHDSLAQILGYLGLEVQTIEALVRQQDMEAVLGQLRLARKTIKVAQADVRESILSLRTMLAGDTNVIEALRQYIEEFGIQTGMKITLEVPGDFEPKLSPIAETQLVRIVQEALTNVRKHAQANAINVNFMVYDEYVKVVVVDDGVGFQQDIVGHSHFGLQTMRERAESVGGILSVNSIPGQGTRVELSLPFVVVS